MDEKLQDHGMSLIGPGTIAAVAPLLARRRLRAGETKSRGCAQGSRPQDSSACRGLVALLPCSMIKEH
jgi:hypothetical protein